MAVVSQTELKALADDAVPVKIGRIQKQAGDPNLLVSCRYIVLF